MTSFVKCGTQNLDLKSSQNKSLESSQKVDQSNREIKKNLARLERFYEHEQNVALQKMQGQAASNLTELKTEHYPSCLFLSGYLTVINRKKIVVFELGLPTHQIKQHQQIKFSKNKVVQSIPPKQQVLNSQINLFDVYKNPNKLGVDIVFVTKNSNGLFTIYLNSVDQRKDESDNIYGVAFLDNSNILIRLATTFETYDFKLTCVVRCNLSFNEKDCPLLQFAEKPTVLRVFKQAIFFVYVHMLQKQSYQSETKQKQKQKQIDYVVVLEQYKNQTQNQHIGLVQRIIIHVSSCPQTIRDMTIVQSENDNTLQIYVVLENEIINVKQKKSQQHFGDNDKHFFTVECSLKSPQPHKKIDYKPANLHKNNVFQKDNVLLLKTFVNIPGHKNKFKTNLYAVHVEYRSNSISDPNTASIYKIKNDGNRTFCNLNCSLKDILFIETHNLQGNQKGLPENKKQIQENRNKEKIIYCFQFGFYILLVHFNQISPNEISLSIYVNSSKKKMADLLQPISKNSFISEKRMQLLMKYYAVKDQDSILGEFKNKKQDLFKKIWQKLIETKLKASNSNLTSTAKQTVTESSTTLISKIGQKNMQYLYNVQSLDYIHQQIRFCIKHSGKIQLKALKNYYENIKRISAEDILKNCQKPPDQSIKQLCYSFIQKDEPGEKKNVQQKRQIKLTEYLKSIFYLRKLQQFEVGEAVQDIELSDFQRWQKRRADQYLDLNWGNQKKMLNFVNRHYHYFLNNYEQIMRIIIENKMITREHKDKTKQLLKNLPILFKLLPQYADQSYLKIRYEQQKQINRQNNTNIFIPIQKYIYFQGLINHVHQELTIDDLKVIFPGLQDKQIFKDKEYLQKNYMRNNDFLFKSKKQIDQIQRKLTQKKQAIYIFFELIVDKLDKIPDKEIVDSNATQIQQSVYKSESTIHDIFNQLKKQRHINNNDYFHLMIGIRMHELGRRHNIDVPPLSKFLQKSDIWKLQHLLLNRLDKQNIFDNREIFKNIWNVWVETWKAVCQPGDKYFRYVLSNQEVNYNIELENFNNKEQIHNLIFQSVFKRYFLEDQSNKQVSQIEYQNKHEKHHIEEVQKKQKIQQEQRQSKINQMQQMFKSQRLTKEPAIVPNQQKQKQQIKKVESQQQDIQISYSKIDNSSENVSNRYQKNDDIPSKSDSHSIKSKQKKIQTKSASRANTQKIYKLKDLLKLITSMDIYQKKSLKLLVEFLLESVFQKTAITQENKSHLVDIFQLINNYISQINKLVSQNQSQDQEGYQYERTRQKLNNYRYQNDQYSRKQEFDTLESKMRILNMVIRNYKIFTDFDLDFTINTIRGYEHPTIEDKWLKQISKIQKKSMKGKQKNISLFKWSEEQQNDYQVPMQLINHYCEDYQMPKETFNMKRLDDVFQFQIQFLKIYNNRFSESEQFELRKMVYNVALEDAYNGSQDDLLRLNELINVEMLVINHQQDHDRSINLNQQTLLQRVLKQWISKAKKEFESNKFDFIESCLEVMERMYNGKNDLDEYIRTQKQIVLLKKQQFEPSQVKEIKIASLELSMRHRQTKKQLFETYVKCMSQYIDNKIDELFKNNRIPSLNQISKLNQEFQPSFYYNFEVKYNKPYESDYLILKLILTSVENNRKHLLKDLEDRNQGKQKERTKTKSSLNVDPRVLNFISKQFSTIDLKNIHQTVGQSYSLFGERADRNQMNDLNNVELNESDIKIYSYFPEYVSEVKYFLLGKMFQLEKRSEYVEFDKNAKDSEQETYERTFTSNMVFIVRYWEHLNYQLDKIMLLIKISLDDPSRFQSNKKRDIEEVCNMLANLLELETNKYIYRMKSQEELEQFYKKKKKQIQQTKKKNNKQNKKLTQKEAKKQKQAGEILKVLNEFLEKLKQFKNNQCILNKNRMKLSSKSRENRDQQNDNNGSKNIQNRFSQDESHKRRYYGAQVNQNRQEQFEKYFTADTIQQFIQKVEKQIVSEEKTIKRHNKDFNLSNYRKFVTCIKFDKTLTKYFTYQQFFFTSEDFKAHQIFEKHLKSKIVDDLKDQNYLQIGKSLRYGLGNLSEIEVEVTKLYLINIRDNHFNISSKSPQVTKQFKQKIKQVFDMMDTGLIKLHYNSFNEILREKNMIDILDPEYLGKYMKDRGWEKNTEDKWEEVKEKNR